MSDKTNGGIYLLCYVCRTNWLKEMLYDLLFGRQLNSRHIIPDFLTLIRGIYCVAGDEGWSKDCSNIKDC